jgi:two-component system, NtrC family, response regulator GlrR
MKHLVDAGSDATDEANVGGVTKDLGLRTPSCLVRQIRLTVAAGPDAGRTMASRGVRTVVGKDPSADLVLNDDAVSRFHCEIVVEDNVATLRDLGSRNGSFVNGVRVGTAWLHDGAKVTVGTSTLRFDLSPDRLEVPLSTRDHFGELHGTSPAIRAVFAILERAAACDFTLLIEGETGTGKELAAESVHAESRRRDGPFVVVDCGSIAPNLIESELFGHERGAFTGAVARRTGAFEAAHGGTLFLDEIGELPGELQSRLLRALERREIKRLGSTEYTPVDIRIIAATHRDLREEVNRRRFRSDLYYRLAVLRVTMPALRQRPEDLLPLVTAIVAQPGVGVVEGPEAALLSPAFIDELARHQWPGNIRELRNYVERCIALGRAPPVEPAASDPAGPAAPPQVDVTRPLREVRQQWLRALETQYLTELLAVHGNNVSAAARAAGVGRANFYRLLWRSGIR